MAIVFSILITALLVASLGFLILFSSSWFLGAFAISSLIAFGFGQSRLVIAPTRGIASNAVLSPEDFHQWSRIALRSSMFESNWEMNPNVGYDEKLGLQSSRTRALVYRHSVAFLVIFLAALLAVESYVYFVAPSLFRGDVSVLTSENPVFLGIAMGSVWGYALGVLVRWLKCRPFKISGEPPL